VIHGVSKLQLSYQSVLDALQGFLNDHTSVVVKVKSWNAEGYAPNQTVWVEFEQEQPTQEQPFVPKVDDDTPS
jgi:hypothetical protein